MVTQEVEASSQHESWNRLYFKPLTIQPHMRLTTMHSGRGKMGARGEMGVSAIGRLNCVCPHPTMLPRIIDDALLLTLGGLLQLDVIDSSPLAGEAMRTEQRLWSNCAKA